MKIFATEKLTHTLQTWVGMVRDNGRPQQRPWSDLPNYLLNNESLSVKAKAVDPLSEKAFVLLFTSCVLECRLPQFNDPRFFIWQDRSEFDRDIARLKSNIHACCDFDVGIAFMKRNIRALQRLDLEQAAAIVISAIRNDASITNRMEIVSVLIQELDLRILTQSCMWLERRDLGTEDTVDEAKLSRLVNLFLRYLDKHNLIGSRDISDLGSLKDWSSLLPVLLRVRRCYPRARCLFIPQWVFVAAHVKPPVERRVWDSQGRIKRGHEPLIASDPFSDTGDIVLGRIAFRALQRRLLNHHRFWIPEIRLRKAIADLEADVIYCAHNIQSQVLPSQDTLVVAHCFFALQRRMQRKVVSDLGWTEFLKKGESGNILQNNPEIPTTFEKRLGEFSGQDGVPVTGDVLSQIDQCCLLMEEYVSVYGQGNRKNLVFAPGMSGGSGRGAVDDYNLLCDILKTLCKAAKEQNLERPGPVRKFLAKDIMACNQSFEDDAFANDRVPGWEPWLAQRREKGLLHSIGNLKVSEDAGASERVAGAADHQMEGLLD